MGHFRLYRLLLVARERLHRKGAAVLGLTAIGLISCLLGCMPENNPGIPTGSHAQFGWEAEEYFSDPKVIELCEAIEANDLNEIDRLVAAGANVNAKGKGGMTPLLWAFPDDKLPRFRKLLELGADPNVRIKSRFGTNYFRPGDTVVHLAAKTTFDGYLRAVLDHGGDPNSKGAALETPLTLVIAQAPDKQERIRLLIEAGADPNRPGPAGRPPVIEAIVSGGQYDLALSLLKEGADPLIRKEPDLLSFVELLTADVKRRSRYWSPQQKSDYLALEKWLTNRGISLSDARADMDRWQAWSKEHPGVRNVRETLGYKDRAARHAEELKRRVEVAADKSDAQASATQEK